MKRAFSEKYILTHSLMELSPSWEAANCAATRELHSILWNPEVHHRVHISLPPVPILSQIDPIPTIPSYLSKIHFNIVHPSTSRRMRCAGHVARMGERRNAYRILVGKPEGKRPLGEIHTHLETIRFFWNPNIYYRFRWNPTMLLYFHVYVVRVTKIRGSSSDNWIYWHFGYNLS
jgi:hypothetical protein